MTHQVPSSWSSSGDAASLGSETPPPSLLLRVCCFLGLCFASPSRFSSSCYFPSFQTLGLPISKWPSAQPWCISFPFYIAALTNHHKCSSLNQMDLLSCSCVDQKPNTGSLAETLVLAELPSFLEAVGEELFPCSLRGWQSSVSCGCKTEIPVSLLAVS